ncbi:MAG: PAS domain S-box protein [Chloroflexota bacterium]
MTGKKAASPKVNKGKSKTDRPPVKKSTPPKPKQAGKTVVFDRIDDGGMAFDADTNSTYNNRGGDELLGHTPKDLSEQTFSVIFKKAPFAAGLTNIPDGTYLEANEEFERVFGFTREEIVGKTSLELGMYPDPQVRERMAQQFREQGFVHNLDVRLRTRSGEIRDVLINSDLVEIGGEKFILTTANDITERKRAEEALMKSDMKWRSLVETIPDYIALYDANGNYQFLNHYAEGFSARDVVGKHYSLFLPGAARQLYHEAMERIRQTGKREFIEHEGPGDQGMTRYYESYIVPIFEQDTLTNFMVIARDITERKRAGEELRLSGERFSKAFHMSPAGMTITRITDGKFIDANDSFCRMFEFTREEVIGHTSTELKMWTPEERNKLIDEQIRSGGLQDFELQARSKSGRIVNLLFSSKPIELAGEPHHITTMIDITERKRAEEQIKFQARLLAQVNDAVIATDENRIITYWNRAAEELHGWSADEAIGRSTNEVARADFSEAQRADALRQLSETGYFSTEVLVHPRNKEPIWLEGKTSTLRDESGRITGYLAVNRDMTERKLAEEELRANRDRLAELSRQLVHTHETESRAIGRELHDQIGQMLTALKLTLEIAPQLPPQQAAKKLTGAHELLDDLISRVSRLSLELRPAILDDLGLIPALLWHVNRYQEQSGIHVEFTHSGMEHRRFDFEVETTVYRVVQESLTNVARHARTARARLDVRAGSEEIVIRIEDEGAGFDPHAALALNRGLTGMRERVSLLGGSFEIESQPGKGTKKLIRLPLKEKQE